MQAEISHVEFRAALKACGLSQKTLADMVGRTEGMVSKWATGTNPVPKYVACMLILANKEDARHNCKDFSGNAFPSSYLFEWYEVLGLDHMATLEQAKKARNELAKKYHPDMKVEGFASPSIMTRVSAAFEEARTMLEAQAATRFKSSSTQAPQASQTRKAA